MVGSFNEIRLEAWLLDNGPAGVFGGEPTGACSHGVSIDQWATAWAG